MGKRCSINATEVFRIYTKTQPKVEQCSGGWIYSFSEVLSLSQEQFVESTNMNPIELQSKLSNKSGLKLVRQEKKSKK